MEILSLKLAELKSESRNMIAEENHFRTSEAAFAVNRNGRIVAWNRAAVTAFGFTRSSALNRRCWELLSGRDIFGNPFCCKSCPIHNAAFTNKPVNQFRINFSTDVQTHKQFTVSTMMLFNGSGSSTFVHLCRPEPEAPQSVMPQQVHPNSRWRPLTPRETEVLALMHKGMTIPEIAELMSVSLCTVRNHCQHIFLKLRVHSRFEAVATGRKLRLI